MKLALTILSVLTMTSAAFADGAPLMTCQPKTVTPGAVSVTVDRSIVRKQGAVVFQDTLSAFRAEERDSASTLATEVVDFQLVNSMDRRFKGATVDLALTYVKEYETDSTGGFARVFDGVLNIAGSSESYQMTCTLMDHD